MSTRVLSGVVLASLLSACAVDPGPETVDETEQGLVLSCDGTRSWRVIWSQNGVEVGRESCDCGSTQIWAQGVLQGSRKTVIDPPCPGPPPPPPPPPCLTVPSTGPVGQSAPPICP